MGIFFSSQLFNEFSKKNKNKLALHGKDATALDQYKEKQNKTKQELPSMLQSNNYPILHFFSAIHVVSVMHLSHEDKNTWSI